MTDGRCPSCGALLATGDPSPAQARVLEFIVDFHERRGRFPLYREIRIGMGYTSTAAATRQVAALASKGLLTVRKHYGIVGARGVEPEPEVEA